MLDIFKITYVQYDYFSFYHGHFNIHFYACTGIYALNLLSYLYTLNIAIAGFLEKQLSFMYFISRFKINSSYFVT